MILLGHSFGGFLASAYAIRYPNRLHHLVLADPWGFPEKPPDAMANSQVPIWIKMVAKVIQPFNPLAGLRAAGPWGKHARTLNMQVQNYSIQPSNFRLKHLS